MLYSVLVFFLGWIILMGIFYYVGHFCKDFIYNSGRDRLTLVWEVSDYILHYWWLLIPANLVLMVVISLATLMEIKQVGATGLLKGKITDTLLDRFKNLEYQKHDIKTPFIVLPTLRVITDMGRINDFITRLK